MKTGGEIRTFLELSLQDIERRNQCYAAVHDHWGGLVTQDRLPFFSNRVMHRSPACCWRRDESQVFNLNCVRHCKQAILEHSLRTSEPYLADCWKGLTEVVVPVCDQRQLLATLYFGSFRRGADCAGIPAELRSDADYSKLYYSLPELTGERQTALTREARLVALAIQELYRQQKEEIVSSYQGRSRQILEFIHTNAHRDIGLTDLARHLNLSVSRTSHLVKELFQRSMHHLLRRERIRRAEVLLQNSELTLADVADQSGFGNEFYFNRVFRQLTGITPGRYRRRLSEAGK